MKIMCLVMIVLLLICVGCAVDDKKDEPVLDNSDVEDLSIIKNLNYKDYYLSFINEKISNETSVVVEKRLEEIYKVVFNDDDVKNKKITFIKDFVKKTNYDAQLSNLKFEFSGQKFLVFEKNGLVTVLIDEGIKDEFVLEYVNFLISNDFIFKDGYGVSEEIIHSAKELSRIRVLMPYFEVAKEHRINAKDQESKVQVCLDLDKEGQYDPDEITEVLDCIKDGALTTKDFEYCEFVSRVSITQNAPNSAYSHSKHEAFKNCYSAVCSKISDDVKRDVCYFNYAINQHWVDKTGSSCSVIKDKNVRSICKTFFVRDDDYYNTQKCRLFLAEWRHDGCYGYVADKVGDSELCEFILDTDYKKTCISQAENEGLF